MEEDVLKGAAESIAKHSPIMMIEVLKTGEVTIDRLLSAVGYKTYLLGYMLLAVHASDPLSQNIRFENGALSLGRL